MNFTHFFLICRFTGISSTTPGTNPGTTPGTTPDAPGTTPGTTLNTLGTCPSTPGTTPDTCRYLDKEVVPPRHSLHDVPLDLLVLQDGHTGIDQDRGRGRVEV